MLGLALPPGLVLGAISSLLAIEMTDTVSLGVWIVGALITLATAVGIFWGVRYKSGYDTASAAARELRESLADSLDREERLERKLDETTELNAELRETVERLSQLEKLEIVIGMMNRNSDKLDRRAEERLTAGIQAVKEYVDTRFDGHEDHAQERHDAQLKVSKKILERLEALGRVT